MALPNFNSAEHLYASKGDAILAAMNDIYRNWADWARNPTEPHPTAYIVNPLLPSLGALRTSVTVGFEGNPEVYTIEYAEVDGKFGWVFDAIP